jgi:restriction system protein
MTAGVMTFLFNDSSTIPLAVASLAVLVIIADVIFVKVRGRGAGVTFREIDSMDGKKFEEFCAERFRKLGYTTDTTPSTGDYGIDLLLKRKGITVAVQTKRYNGTVGVKAVQQAASGKAMYGADTVMVVTNSTYTKAAETLAEANGVVLWGRREIAEVFGVRE